MTTAIMDSLPGHRSNDAQSRAAWQGTISGSNHASRGTHPATVPGDPNTDSNHKADGTHTRAVAVGGSGQPATPWLADPTLALAADILDDLETVRIANQNRYRQLTRTATDSDGENRGFGLDERHPDVARLAALIGMLEDAEHQATLNLGRALRQHALWPWIKAQKGVGQKTAARLLAIIGDPYVRATTGEVRTVSQLWAYCGHGDPARRPIKGMTQAEMFRLGNPTAKKRVWLISTSILKAQGPLSEVYYARKTTNEGRLHTGECRRCGPSGKPALPGSVWSDAHRHADALRVTGKEFLRLLWREAERLHLDPGSSHREYDTQMLAVAAGPFPPQANLDSAPKVLPLAGTTPTNKDTP